MKLRPGMITFARPRDSFGQFADGETAGSPADMAAAYGHPAQRPASWGGKIGAAALLAGGTALAASKLAKRLKK